MSRRGPQAPRRGWRAVPVRGLIIVIELYRHMVSPLRLPSCRFVPTCSQYAVEALSEYGLIRGSWLAVIRLAKCGPWHRGGWDPIPERTHCGAGCGETDETRDSPAQRRESERVVL